MLPNSERWVCGDGAYAEVQQTCPTSPEALYLIPNPSAKGNAIGLNSNEPLGDEVEPSLAKSFSSSTVSRTTD
jgi:hypothetical protein